MPHFEIRAIGKLRGPLAEVLADYRKRLGEDCKLSEYEPPKGLTGIALQRKEAAFLIADLPAHPVIVLDERGKDEGSVAFAQRLARWQEAGGATFLLGGADGHAPEVRERADYLLTLGQKTWPHLLARVMLVEQIYRARQILAGHPYHRV
ncbi:MAG: 23S rRNA (pseudouridine(1915)-N(3))-methyltransferase RlmH [Alphaproteobacteria bacterium]|nr:23S rRNA (pseudouridine(1915)-N(3))-methyltransferase RlmH [Alphaproteobacteria bacterium]